MSPHAPPAPPLHGPCLPTHPPRYSAGQPVASIHAHGWHCSVRARSPRHAACSCPASQPAERPCNCTFSAALPPSTILPSPRAQVAERSAVYGLDVTNVRIINPSMWNQQAEQMNAAASAASMAVMESSIAASAPLGVTDNAAAVAVAPAPAGGDTAPLDVAALLNSASTPRSGWLLTVAMAAAGALMLAA